MGKLIPIKLLPAYKDYICGGEKLRTNYGKNTDMFPLAESCELRCHKYEFSTISGGVYKGKTLEYYIKENKGCLGTLCKSNELPILIKLIDAQDNLSVQVHPDDVMAKELEKQNGNVTYCLYDYNRKDKKGNAREPHIEKGVKAAKCGQSQPKKIFVCSDSTKLIGSCEYFAVKELKLNGKKEMFADEKSYQAIMIVDGTIEFIGKDHKETIKLGETVFIPANFGEYTLSGKATILITSNQPEYYIGIDLGGTNIVAAVVDEYGVIYGRAKRKTNAPRSYQEIFDDMAACAKEAAEESGIAFKDIKSVGIGCPGAINKETGNIEFSNNLHFYDVPIVSYMENLLGKKVYVENDANAAAWGEFLVGSGKGTDSMVMITLGTGVGGGVVENGRLLTGAYGKGAELGHMVISYGGAKCTCGRRGCFEAYASATALIEMTKKAMKENRKSDMWTIVNKKLFNVTGKTAFLSKDGTGKKVVKEYLTNLSEGIVNIINIFQPEIVCVGGGVSNAGEKIIKPVRTDIKNKSYARFGQKQSEVQIAKLGNDAGIIGAALLWKNK